MTKTAATPYKLRDGSWGAKAGPDVSKGGIVTITARSGKSWDARVECVLWTDGKIALCKTSNLGKSRNSGRHYDPDKFNGYGSRKGGYVRSCKTDGNCSSLGSGRSCGAEDCDGY